MSSRKSESETPVKLAGRRRGENDLIQHRQVNRIAGIRSLGSRARGKRRDGTVGDGSQGLAQSLIGEIEKRRIPLDGTAERSAKLIIFEWRPAHTARVGEEIVCIESIVAEELEQAAVKFVRS